MPVLSKLVVSLQVNHAKFTKGLNDAKGKLARFNKSTQSASRVLTRLSVVSAAAGAGLALFIKGAIDSADELSKLSDKLGVSVEEMSKYKFVTEATGVSFNTFTMALQRMTRRVAEAAIGTGEAQSALKELEISAKDLSKLRPEQQFEVLADALEGVKGKSDKLRLAFKLFDSEGVQVLQTMKGGTAAINELKDAAARAGAVISTETANAAAQFNTDLALLKTSASAAGIAMASDLLPSLNNITKAMIEASKDSSALMALFVGFGGVVHELAGGDIGQISRDISGFNDEIAILKNRLSAAEQFFVPDALFGSPEEIKEKISNILLQIEKLEAARERLISPAVAPKDDDPIAEGSAFDPKAEAAAAKIKSAFDSINESLRREKALLFDNSQLAQIRYDLESGKLKDLNADMKAIILSRAEELNLSKEMIEADKEAADALDKLTEETNDYNKAIAEEIQALNDAADPFSVLSREIAHLDDLLNSGLSWDAYAKAVQDATDAAESALDKLDGKGEETADKLGEFAKQAAKNIQDELGDSLFNIMDGKFDDIGSSFDQLIKRMIANALAAQIGEKLFPNLNNEGGGTGNSFFDRLFTGVSGLIPGFANGTNFAPGGMALVGERGPELVNLPRGSQVTPNGSLGGMTVVNNFTVTGQTDKRSQQQIADAAYRGTTRANRRNG